MLEPPKPGEILDEELTLADLPGEDSGELAIHQFALTTNGYERMGSHESCAELANKAFEAWQTTQNLPGSLRQLRCCLFFEQRRWHHFGDPFDEEALRYVRALIGETRKHLLQKGSPQSPVT